MVTNKNIQERKCLDDLSLSLSYLRAARLARHMSNDEYGRTMVGSRVCMASMCAMEIIEAAEKESLLFFFMCTFVHECERIMNY